MAATPVMVRALYRALLRKAATTARSDPAYVADRIREVRGRPARCCG
jgi:hypothetical protein